MIGSYCLRLWLPNRSNSMRVCSESGQQEYDYEVVVTAKAVRKASSINSMAVVFWGPSLL